MRARVLRHGKFGSPMSLMGQTRSFGDVGSMSGLPESGRAADTGGRLESAWRSWPRSLNGTICLAALLATLVAVPVAMERNRDVPPDVWTGAAPTEPSQEWRDREMRDKMRGELRGELLQQVKIYAPINAISLACGIEATDQKANSAMLKGVQSDPEAAKLVAEIHWNTQLRYRLAAKSGDKAEFCSQFLSANSQYAK
jgi:hypothetical protein